MKKYARKFLGSFVNFLAKLRGFSFPEKFTWRWKLEMLLGRYEPETTALFKKIVKSGMTVIDIGAHIGYFTRLFSKLVGVRGQVFAFEADAENFSLLQKNTVWRKNVTLINKAVSAENGTVNFYHIPTSTGCHSTVAPNETAQKISVPAVSLDSFLEKEKPESVGFIKMDIEGGEPSALLGMKKTLAHFPHIMLVTEFNPSALFQGNNNPLTYLEQIESLGFALYAITRKQLLPTTANTVMSLQDKFHQTGFLNIICRKK